MTIRLAPVHDAAAVPRVDLHVDRAVRGTPIRDGAGRESCENAGSPSISKRNDRVFELNAHCRRRVVSRRTTKVDAQ
jgi:hypothetical protein